MRSNRVAVERSCHNWIRPIGLIGTQSRCRLPIELHQIERFVVARSIELFHGFLQLARIESQFDRKVMNRVCFFGLLVGSIVHPTWPETLHDGIVGDEETLLVVIAPQFESDHFESSKQMPLTLVVEALALLIHHNAVVVAPYDRVRLGCARVYELAVHTVERSCCAGSDLKSHVQPCTLIVLQTGSDQRKLVRARTDVLGEHLAISFKAPTGKYAAV